MRGGIAVGVAALAVASALVLPPAGAAHDGVHVPLPRVGDEAFYGPEGPEAPANRTVAFAWAGPEATSDRWSRPREAHVLRAWLPAALRDPDAGADRWFEVREAYATSEPRPLWRADVEQSTWLQGWQQFSLPLAAVSAGALQPITNDDNRTLVTYAPEPWLRSCLARHGFQGRAVAAVGAVPLAALCPGLASSGLDARPMAARKATFLGRAAVVLVYDLPAGLAVGDLALPPGSGLRVVLADGLPYLAEAEATDAVGTLWRFRLAGVRAGTGPEVPPPHAGAGAPDLADREGMDLRPLTDDGPADGGSGLPYLLAEALANVRADAALGRFQAWLRAHPTAFLAGAGLELGTDPQGQRYAGWNLVFADAPGAGEPASYAVHSRLAYPAVDLPRLAGRPVGAVFNLDRGEGVLEGPVEPPAGRPGLTFAEAWRLASAHAPEAAGRGDLAWVYYLGPAPGRDALVGLQVRHGEAQGRDGLTRTGLLFEAATGAAAYRLEHHRRTVYGPLDLGGADEPLALASAGPAPPDVPALAVVGATLAAVVVAVLAHAGYVAVAYSRLKESDLLAHPTRRRIYDLVRVRSGLHLLGIVEALDAGRNTVLYHLRVLEHGGLVTHVALRKFRRYYVTGTVPSGALRGEAELQSGSARAVYGTVQAEPGLTLADIGQRVGLSREAVRRTVDRLAAAGLVEKRQDGRFVRVAARQTARQN